MCPSKNTVNPLRRITKGDVKLVGYTDKLFGDTTAEAMEAFIASRCGVTTDSVSIKTPENKGFVGNLEIQAGPIVAESLLEVGSGNATDDAKPVWATLALQDLRATTDDHSETAKATMGKALEKLEDQKAEAISWTKFTTLVVSVRHESRRAAEFCKGSLVTDAAGAIAIGATLRGNGANLARGRGVHQAGC